MFKLHEKYEVNRKILERVYIRSSPAETSTKNTPFSQYSINIPRDKSVIPFLFSYLDLPFEVIKKADNSRYANGKDVKLVNLGPIALFKSFKLTMSSGKHVEDINHAQIVSLMYKLETSAKDTDDLSIGFDRDRNSRRGELTNNRNMKVKHHIRILLTDVFGVAEHQEKFFLASVIN